MYHNHTSQISIRNIIIIVYKDMVTMVAIVVTMATGKAIATINLQPIVHEETAMVAMVKILVTMATYL